METRRGNEEVNTSSWFAKVETSDLIAIGFVLLLFALGQAVSFDGRGPYTDGIRSKVKPWLVVTFFALPLIGVAERDFAAVYATTNAPRHILLKIVNVVARSRFPRSYGSGFSVRSYVTRCTRAGDCRVENVVYRHRLPAVRANDVWCGTASSLSIVLQCVCSDHRRCPDSDRADQYRVEYSFACHGEARMGQYLKDDARSILDSCCGAIIWPSRKRFI